MIMIRKSLWRNAILVLAALALLTAPQLSEAQRRGGGRGGRGGVAAGYRGGYRGYGGYGNERGWGNGGYGYGQGYWYGGAWYPGYWNGGFWYAYPNYDYDDSNYYYPPAYQYPTDNEQAAVPMGAVVTVRVPDPAAQIWFNDRLTRQSGQVRTYHTGALDPNWTYHYTIHASWMVNGQAIDQTREIQVYPGKATTVDFSTPSQPVIR
jgi:uncharacterized protein (TIGR03000 family)